MCFKAATAQAAVKPQAAPQADAARIARKERYYQVIDKLDGRAADAITGKKGRDVAQAFTALAEIVIAVKNGADVVAEVDRFVDAFKV